VAEQRVNASPPSPIPRAVEVALARRHQQQIKELSDLIGGCSTRWLQDVEEILATVEPSSSVTE
jgi:hypothetical protein